MPKAKYIVSDPEICGGTPTFKGTRIPVHVILEIMANEERFDKILKAYPSLTRKHIQEALNFAADVVNYQEKDIA